MSLSVIRGTRDMVEDRRRMLIRTIAAQAAQGSLQVSVRQSTGATCALCADIIAPGMRQYDIGVGRSTVIVDEKCYTSSLQRIIEAEPPIGEGGRSTSANNQA